MEEKMRELFECMIKQKNVYITDEVLLIEYDYAMSNPKPIYSVKIDSLWANNTADISYPTQSDIQTIQGIDAKHLIVIN